MTTPELPEPAGKMALSPIGIKTVDYYNRITPVPGYSADQMLAMYRKGLEDAAKLCEQIAGLVHGVRPGDGGCMRHVGAAPQHGHHPR